MRWRLMHRPGLVPAPVEAVRPDAPVGPSRRPAVAAAFAALLEHLQARRPSPAAGLDWGFAQACGRARPARRTGARQPLRTTDGVPASRRETWINSTQGDGLQVGALRRRQPRCGGPRGAWGEWPPSL